MQAKEMTELIGRETKLNLLLVDDDDIALFHYRRIAEMTGSFAVIRSAVNGTSAIDYLKRAAEGTLPFPHVVLLDLQMPVMNGISLLKIIRQWKFTRKEEIEFIMLSDAGSHTARGIADQLGVNYYLSRPVTIENFMDVINKIKATHQELLIR